MARIINYNSFDFDYINKSFSSVFACYGSVDEIINRRIRQLGKDKGLLRPEDFSYFQHVHGVREIKFYFYLTKKHFNIDYKKLPSKKVLDVGCGMGYFTNCFAEFGFDATGVDISPICIELAKRFYPKCRFMLGDSLKKESFEKLGSNYDLILFREYFPFSRFDLLAAQIYLLDLYTTELNDGGCIIIAHSKRHLPNPDNYLGEIDRKRLLHSMLNTKGTFFYIRRSSLVTSILNNRIFRDLFYSISDKYSTFKIDEYRPFQSILMITLIKKG